MKFFNKLLVYFKSFFLKTKKPALPDDTVAVIFDVEHHEGGYYTLPVLIENENFKGFTEIKKIDLDKKDVQ